MHRLNVLLATAVAFGFVLAGCDSGGSNMEEPDREILFEQTFDQNTGGWITNETSGQNGRCSDIAQVGADEGAVTPSDGSGYATAAHAACNEYWSENGFPNGSGPFGFFGKSNDEVGFDGDKGFVQELDVYLDPSQAAPDTTVFTYAASLDLLNVDPPNTFRYFFVPVTKPDETLLVASEAINEAGWYTFRHRFTSEDGSLAVDFELLQDGEVLVTQSVTQTALSGEEVSSFEVSNVGTGYAWFVAIQSGLQVPIDEQTLVRLP